MKLLDLYCCQGGAGVGYYRAGFDVVGVDIVAQPRYPLEFAQADALWFLAEHGHGFDAVHASPPCQAHSNTQRIRGNNHPDLIGPTRDLLNQIGRPWMIENVPGAPLVDPVMLCGAMFGLRTYRHRLFETGCGFELTAPDHPEHAVPTAKMGRRVKPGEFMHVVGNFTGVDEAREIMGMPWANRDGLREAIPPAYSEFVGRQLMSHLTAERVA